jgi:hypothetical protein
VIIRLVIDEAHQVLTCLDYRSLFDRVSTFAMFPVQKIYLTASLPPRLMDRFFTETALPDSTVVIREPTYQPNLRYHVVMIESAVTNINRFSIDLAKRITSQFLGPTRRGIIFCTSIKAVDRIGAAFNNCTSHSKLESSTRLANEESWFAGFSQWIVATTGLIHGVDCSDVGAVVFVGLPFGAMNIFQGSGRAGRNGKPAMVFLVDYTNSQYVSTCRHADEDVNAVHEGKEWMWNSHQCRRVGLSSLMDGQPMTCDGLEGAEKCDVCDPDTDILRAIPSLIPEPGYHPQPPIVPPAVNPVDEDEDFDMGGIDDELIMQVDLSPFQDPPASPPAILPSMATHPSSSVSTHSMVMHPATPSPAILPSMATHSSSTVSAHSAVIRPASLPTLPQTTLSAKPSMPVQLDQAVYSSKEAMKANTAAKINQMACQLLGKCVVCWAWKGRMVPKTPDHKFFFSCKDPEDEYITHAIGWIGFKKRIKLKRYQYCFRCSLPQGQYQPTCHPTFKSGEHMQCPLEDFVVGILWFMRHDREIWHNACRMFRGISPNMTLNELATWAAAGDDAQCFYNGLEAVTWFWLHKK